MNPPPEKNGSSWGYLNNSERVEDIAILEVK